jgi:hypothetical protein
MIALDFEQRHYLFWRAIRYNHCAGCLEKRQVISTPPPLLYLFVKGGNCSQSRNLSPYIGRRTRFGERK